MVEYIMMPQSLRLKSHVEIPDPTLQFAHTLLQKYKSLKEELQTNSNDAWVSIGTHLQCVAKKFPRLQNLITYYHVIPLCLVS